MANEDEIIVVPTQCVDWSLNEDKESDKRFWWNNTYSISIWENNLTFDKKIEDVNDDDVWKSYIEFQISTVYKLCPICLKPEGNEDMKICCYCGSTVHILCSKVADADQIAYKPANTGFEPFMRVCYKCEGEHFTPREMEKEPDNVRRAALRALTMREELPDTTFNKVKDIAKVAEKTPNDKRLMELLQKAVQSFFQSDKSLRFLKKMTIESKGGGIGVVAAADIPAFTIVGVYPGYPDPLCGEQAKMGRPTSKYALMELNCADYYNDVFVELQTTFTPFINEPNETETSNCAWIQEPHRAEGRLSIITVKDVKKDEELLIGYGPLYPRTYPYKYEAYALHPVEGHTDPLCYAIWFWPTKEEKDAVFANYVAYLSDEDEYVYWKTKEEAGEE